MKVTHKAGESEESRLCDLWRCGTGDAVEVSPVMGNGFKVGQLPVDKFDTVLMFATGSGIAPIKALIESDDLQVTQPPSSPAPVALLTCVSRQTERCLLAELMIVAKGMAFTSACNIGCSCPVLV